MLPNEIMKMRVSYPLTKNNSEKVHKLLIEIKNYFLKIRGILCKIL